MNSPLNMNKHKFMPKFKSSVRNGDFPPSEKIKQPLIASLSFSLGRTFVYLVNNKTFSVFILSSIVYGWKTTFFREAHYRFRGHCSSSNVPARTKYDQNFIWIRRRGGHIYEPLRWFCFFNFSSRAEWHFENTSRDPNFSVFTVISIVCGRENKIYPKCHCSVSTVRPMSSTCRNGETFRLIWLVRIQERESARERKKNPPKSVKTVISRISLSSSNMYRAEG